MHGVKCLESAASHSPFLFEGGVIFVGSKAPDLLAGG